MKKIIAEIFLFQVIFVISVNSLLRNNNGCNGIDYSPDEHDCTIFYRCVDYGTYSIKHKFNCGPGTVFDTQTNNCGFPSTIDRPECKRSNDVLSNDDNDDGDQGYNYSNESNELDNNLNPINSIDMNMAPNNEFRCEQEGFFADPANCMKFIRCVDSGSFALYKYSFDCAEGTVWDQDLLTCNYPHSVRNQKCAEMQSNSASTTTTKAGDMDEIEDIDGDKSTTETSSPKSDTTESSENYNKSITELTTKSPETTIDDLVTDSQEVSSLLPTMSTDLSTVPMSLVSTTIDMNSSPIDTSTFSNDSEAVEISTSNTNSETTTVNINSDSVSTTVAMNDVTTQTEISTSTDAITNDNVTDSCSTLDNDNEFLLKCPSNFLRHPKYCNVFYQCYVIPERFDISVSSFQCPDNTVYDETKIQCVPEQNATKKCTSEIFQKKEPSLFRNAENSMDEIFKTEPLCPQKGYFSLNDNTCTNAFIKCEMKEDKLQGLVYQCPEGYVFWIRSRRCEPISKVFECRMQMFPFRNQLPVETENISK